MRGGYKIIDLKNQNFTLGEGMVFNGLHEAIEETRKPIRFTNVVVSGFELRDIDVVLNPYGSSYIGVFELATGIYEVKIEDTDVITISQKPE